MGSGWNDNGGCLVWDGLINILLTEWIMYRKAILAELEVAEVQLADRAAQIGEAEAIAGVRIVWPGHCRWGSISPKGNETHVMLVCPPDGSTGTTRVPRRI